MQGLTKVVVAVLCIIGLAILLAGLTLLSWWMQWPLLTGVVILFTMFAVFLAWKAVCLFWRWRDKKKFVKAVSQDQEDQSERIAAVVDDGFTSAWQAGFKHMSSSRNLYRSALHSAAPCFIVLDVGPGTDTLFDTFGTAVRGPAGSIVSWHFLSAAVLIRYSLRGRTDEENQKFLAALSEAGKMLDVRSIIALFAVNDLQGRDAVGIKTLASDILGMVQRIVPCLGLDLPVHILVENLQVIPGMAEVLEHTDADHAPDPLGISAVAETSMAGTITTDWIVRYLGNRLGDVAVEGPAPSGDMMASFATLASTGRNLDIFSEMFFRRSAYGFTPKSGGFYMCGGVGQNGGRPSCLGTILTSVLPRVASPRRLRRGLLPFYTFAKVRLMAGWLLLCLAFCAILSVNVLYQDYVLRQSPPRHVLVSGSSGIIQELYAQMQDVKRLEKAVHTWPFPFWGQNLIQARADQIKASFVSQTLGNRLLLPLFEEIRGAVGTGRGKLSHTQVTEYSVELFWLAAALSFQMSGDDVLNELEWPYPLTSVNHDRWHPLQGEVILNALNWAKDERALQSLGNEITTLFKLRFKSKTNATLDDIITFLNNNQQSHEIRLSQFWPNIAPESEADVVVPAVFTEQGYAVWQNLLDDIRQFAEADPELLGAFNRGTREYFRRYEQYWRNFLEAFGVQSAQVSQFRNYAEKNGINEIPHIRLLATLGRNLAPLRESGLNLPWTEGFITLDTVTKIALLRQGGMASSFQLKDVFSTMLESPKLMQDLRAASKDAADLRNLFDAVMKLQHFYGDVREVLALFGSQEKSLALASLHFASLDDSRYVENSVYARMVRDGDDAFLHLIKDNASPLARFKKQFYSFMAQGITAQAATAVQTQWESEVMGGISVANQQQDEMHVFTDEKSVLRTFIKENLKSFVRFKGGECLAATWDGVSFPFTRDFLEMVENTENIASKPARDSYDILLCSQPTLVNLGAKELPDSTELRVQVAGGQDFQLINRNYTYNEKFRFEPKSCGKAELTIKFPSFTITRSYATMVDFIDEFRYGERVFQNDDFEGDVQTLKDVNIKEVRVRILPDSVNDMLQSLRHTPPTIPERIITVW